MQNRERKIEIILYIAALFLALGLRLLKLGFLPLGDNEASAALQAMNLANGVKVSVGGQPGYVALTSLLFFLFESSGFLARLWPALFGSAIVLLPLLYRKWLGEKPALFLAFFLALEPGLIALSRTASGTMIGIVCVVAAAGFLFQYKKLWAGVFSGMALLGGTSLWPGLIGLIAAGLILHYIFKRTILPVDESIIEPTDLSISWVKVITAAVVTLGLIGTVFVLHPAVISGLGTSLTNYLQSWASGGGVNIKVMLLGLAGTQFLAIPLAIWGGISGRLNRKPLTGFLVLWFVAATLLVLINPSRQMLDWDWALLPLWTLAALGIFDLWQQYSSGEITLTLIQITATISLIVFSFLQLLVLVSNTSLDAIALRNNLLGVFLPLALLVVITMMLGWGWSIKAARQGLLIGIGAILLMVSFGTAWKAAGLGPRPEVELWRSDPLPIGSTTLKSTVDDLSLWNIGQENRIDVDLVNVQYSSVKWDLRKYDRLSSEDLLGQTQTPSILVTSPDYSLTPQTIYRGQEVIWSAQPDYENMSTREWIKWFVFRRTTVKNESLFLWARNDLFKGSNTQ